MERGNGIRVTLGRQAPEPDDAAHGEELILPRSSLQNSAAPPSSATASTSSRFALGPGRSECSTRYGSQSSSERRAARCSSTLDIGPIVRIDRSVLSDRRGTRRPGLRPLRTGRTPLAPCLVLVPPCRQEVSVWSQRSNVRRRSGRWRGCAPPRARCWHRGSRRSWPADPVSASRWASSGAGASMRSSVRAWRTSAPARGSPRTRSSGWPPSRRPSPRSRSCNSGSRVSSISMPRPRTICARSA